MARAMLDQEEFGSAGVRVAVYESPRQRVTYSLPLATFLYEAVTSRSVPVLVTRPDAELSPLLSLELVRHHSKWAVRRPDSILLDAMTGRTLSGPDASIRQSHIPPWSEDVSRAAVGLDIELFHGADSALVVGELVEGLLAVVGAEAPDVWGDTEPLTERWDTGALTRTARDQMPLSRPMRFATPWGASGSLTYRRTATGVNETLRASIPVGRYPESVERAGQLASELLAAVAKHFTPIYGYASLQDTDPGGGQGVRGRLPETPLAVLMGPWVVGRAIPDVDALTRDFDAVTLGGRYMPRVLVRLDRAESTPGAELARLVQYLGVEEIRTLWAPAGEAAR